MHLLPAMREFEDCDVLIDHSGPFGAHLCAHTCRAALHVIHCPLGPSERTVYESLSETAPTLRFIAISEAQRSFAPSLPFVGVCHNALDPAELPFSAAPGDYLAFLGRISPGKGPGEAIEIAQRLDMPLLMAAKCREDGEKEYFDEVVAPHLGDERIRFLGELSGREKFDLLAGAAALVFPIDWEEPFGMVMIEAMACGTPSLATRRGAVPEVVLDGETGFIRDDVEGLVQAASRLGEIDRHRCRAHVDENFSVSPFIHRYERAIAAARGTADAQASRRGMHARLPRSLDSIDTARGLVDRLTDSHVEEEVREDADLLLTEALANSVMHADGDEVGLSADVTDGTMRVEVTDGGPGTEMDGERRARLRSGRPPRARHHRPNRQPLGTSARPRPGVVRARPPASPPPPRHLRRWVRGGRRPAPHGPSSGARRAPPRCRPGLTRGAVRGGSRQPRGPRPGSACRAPRASAGSGAAPGR